MADINIQRKKTAPSPWLLVLLSAVALAVAAYFFLRPDPADEPVPAATAVGTGSVDTLVSGTPADQARTASPASEPDSVATTPTAESAPATLATQVAADPAAPNYALNGLQKLTGALVAMTDRDDLRNPTVTEQRDNLTSATSRLGEANTSLRPGFVAAAGLIQTIQQKSYPEMESKVSDLVRLAGQLSGRSVTAFDQQQNKQFLTQAAAAVRAMSEPPH